MIKDNQKVFNRLMVMIDAATTAASFMLAYFFKFYVLNDGPGLGVLPVTDYLMLLLFIVPVYMLIYYMCGVYTPKRTIRRRFEVYGIVKSNTIGIVALIIILYMIVREFNVSRSVMAFFYIFNVSQVVENQNFFIFILKIRMSKTNRLNPKEYHTQ